jgi:hypothetical protein
MATRQEIQSGIDTYSSRRGRIRPYKLSVPRKLPASSAASQKTSEEDNGDEVISNSDREKETETTTNKASRRSARNPSTKVSNQRTSPKRSGLVAGSEKDAQETTETTAEDHIEIRNSGPIKSDLFGDSMGNNESSRPKKRKYEKSYSGQDKNTLGFKTSNIHVRSRAAQGNIENAPKTSCKCPTLII